MIRNKTLARRLGKEIDAALQQFTALWPEWETAGNPEPPHRQRTAVNRLRGFALFLELPEGRNDPRSGPRRTLRAWQKRCGPLRDLDVVRLWLMRCQGEAGGEGGAAAASLEAELAAQREALHTALATDARGYPGAQVRFAAAEVREEFAAALQELGNAPTPFAFHEALRRVLVPWEAGIARIRETPADEVLHGFRVQNKRLRFVLEVLEPAFKRTPAGLGLKQRLDRVQEIHTILGNLSDLAVFRDLLRRARARWVMDGRGLDASADALEAGRMALERAEFLRWFALWPTLSAPAFTEGLLPTAPQGEFNGRGAPAAQAMVP